MELVLQNGQVIFIDDETGQIAPSNKFNFDPTTPPVPETFGPIIELGETMPNYQEVPGGVQFNPGDIFDFDTPGPGDVPPLPDNGKPDKPPYDPDYIPPWKIRNGSGTSQNGSGEFLENIDQYLWIIAGLLVLYYMVK